MPISPEFQRYIQMFGPYDGHRRGPTELSGSSFALGGDQVSGYALEHAVQSMAMGSSLLSMMDEQMAQLRDQHKILTVEYVEAMDQRDVIERRTDRELESFGPQTMETANGILKQIQQVMGGGPLFFGMPERTLSSVDFMYAPLHRSYTYQTDSRVVLKEVDPCAVVYIDPDSQMAYLHPEPPAKEKAAEPATAPPPPTPVVEAIATDVDMTHAESFRPKLNKIYENAFYRDPLIEKSLTNIDGIIQDPEKRFGATTPPERALALHVLLDTVHQRDYEAAPDCYVHSPLWDLSHDRIGYDRPYQRSVRCGSRSVEVAFSPPPPQQDHDFLQQVEDFAKLYATLGKCRRFFMSSSPDERIREALEGVRVLRSVYHYDAQQTRRFQTMLRAVGDAYAAAGVLGILDKMEPDVRAHIEPQVVRSLHYASDDTRKEHDWAALIDKEVFNLTMKPAQVEVESFSSEAEAVRRTLHRARGERTSKWEPVDVMPDLEKCVAQMREPGQSLHDAMLPICGLYENLLPRGVPAKNVDQLVTWLGENYPSVASSLPEKQGRVAVFKEIAASLCHNRMESPPPETELLHAALETRRPEESLRQACDRISNYYWLTADVRGQDQLQAAADRCAAHKEFVGDADAAQLAEEIEAHMQTYRMLGKPPAEALAGAEKMVLNLHRKPSDVAVQQGAREVKLNGISIPVRQK